VLFEMLTGRVPYEGGQPAEVAWRHVEQDVPPPSRSVPGLPPALDALVARATSRDPAGRPTDAGAMHAEAQAAREEISAALARSQQASHPTVVVPRVGSEAPTTMFDRSAPTATVYAAGADRPAWARLGGSKQPPAATAPLPTPRRRATHGGDRGGQPSLATRINADPRRRLALVAGLVALGLIVTIAGWWLGIGRYTTAPRLVDMSRDDAIAAAHRDGFNVDFDGGRFDEQIAKGTVLDQHPGAGERIVSGSLITLTLSKGPERYQIPDLAGQPYDLAERDLAQIRLTPKRAERYDDNIPVGSVVATDPTSGTEVRPGTTVTVWVSKGRAPITVPNVTGKSRQEAEEILSKLRLNVEVTQQDSDKPRDQVLSQTPEDGAGAESGDTVTLTVSNGPPFVEMPDVRGKSADEARTTLEELGLEVQVIGGGTVRIQNPQPGSHIDAGTKVTLYALG